MPAKALLELVAHLVKDADLRSEFNQNPDRVANRFGLNDAEKLALFTMDLSTVANEVRQEILNLDFAFMQGEFPRTGPMFQPELDETTSEYPAPTPDIFRIVPRSASIAAGKVEINVYGQSFTRDAQVVVTITGGATKLTVKGHRVYGTYRCSHARAVVTPPAAAGTYVVQIQNAPSLPNRPPLVPVLAQAPTFTFTVV